MIEKGARHLIILSRSGEELPRNRAFIEDLKSQSGCHVVSVTGSVANLTDTQRAVSAATKPIAGVIQMSMVLRVRIPCSCNHIDNADVYFLPPGC
jgi:hypothetical protein